MKVLIDHVKWIRGDYQDCRAVKRERQIIVADARYPALRSNNPDDYLVSIQTEELLSQQSTRRHKSLISLNLARTYYIIWLLQGMI